MSRYYNLCLAWNWEYDEWFTRLLQAACDARGLSLVQITPDNLEAMLLELTGNRMSFGNYYDWASDSDERFLTLVASPLNLRRSNSTGIRFLLIMGLPKILAGFILICSRNFPGMVRSCRCLK